MRILLVMDPFIKVPPDHYGGIERVVADLADGYVARGHDVTLWAAPGSRTAARLKTFGREGEWTRWSNARNVATLTSWLVREAGAFDVIHNFGRLAYLTSVLRRDVPKVQTYMRPVNPRNIGLTERAGARRLRFTAVSDAIRRTGAPGGGRWSVIYNCARPSLYTPRFDVDAATAPLVFLGRLERCKGAHTAIAVARAVRRPLMIAGNISTLPDERDYFERDVRPHVDGVLVRYIGPVRDAAKNELLNTAAALLSPVEWEEPFPVIIPEALLCGTPVVAFRRGGMPEGIDHGRTGFLCDDAAGMAACVGRLPSIDRRACRAEGERRFSDAAIIGEYLDLYRGLGAP
jgi:glycosyltransferase involved in cell wall biosynthesis